jgi:hypothetical protein
MRLRFWEPKIGFDGLREQMMKMPSDVLEESEPPIWIQNVTDWALDQALATPTFSQPWEKSLLQRERTRRDRLYTVYLPAGCAAAFGALMSVLIELIT